MNNITETIKEEIKRQYKSIYHFSEVSGIPYSTISNMLAKGIGSTSYETVLKVFNLLNLNQAVFNDAYLFNDQYGDIVSMLSKLDEQGIHTVKTILTMEYNRCSGENRDASIKPFNGLIYAREPIDNTKNLQELVKKAAKR